MPLASGAPTCETPGVLVTRHRLPLGFVRTGLAAFALAWLCAALPTPASAEGEGRLTIRFSGLETTGGELLLSVANSRAIFESEDEAFLQASVPVAGSVESVTFEGVAPGEYAVKVFHDANSNQELDIGWTGPTEKFGFSNNVVGFMGLPDWDDAKVRFDGGEQTLSIEAR